MERLRFSWQLVSVRLILDELALHECEINRVGSLPPELRAEIIAQGAKNMFDRAKWLSPVEDHYRRTHETPSSSDCDHGKFLRSPVGRKHVADALKESVSLLVMRHEGQRWPGGSSVVDQYQGMTRGHSWVQDLLAKFASGFERFRQAVLAAPLVAAGIAADPRCGCAEPQTSLLMEILRTRAFDEEWFDDAYSWGVILWMQHHIDSDSGAYDGRTHLLVTLDAAASDADDERTSQPTPPTFH